MNCTPAQRKLSEDVRDPQLHIHLQQCGDCRLYAETLDAVLHHAPATVPPAPQGLHGRVLAGVAHGTAVTGVITASAPTERVQHEDVAPPIPPAGRVPPWQGWPWAVGAVAAAISAVLVVAWTPWADSGDDRQPAAMLAAAVEDVLGEDGTPVRYEVSGEVELRLPPLDAADLTELHERRQDPPTTAPREPSPPDRWRPAHEPPPPPQNHGDLAGDRQGGDSGDGAQWRFEPPPVPELPTLPGDGQPAPPSPPDLGVAVDALLSETRTDLDAFAADVRADIEQRVAALQLPDETAQAVRDRIELLSELARVASTGADDLASRLSSEPARIRLSYTATGHTDGQGRSQQQLRWHLHEPVTAEGRLEIRRTSEGVWLRTTEDGSWLEADGQGFFSLSGVELPYGLHELLSDNTSTSPTELGTDTLEGTDTRGFRVDHHTGGSLDAWLGLDDGRLRAITWSATPQTSERAEIDGRVTVTLQREADPEPIDVPDSSAPISEARYSDLPPFMLGRHG